MTRLETLATQAKAEGGGRKGLRYCGIGLFLVIDMINDINFFIP